MIRFTPDEEMMIWLKNIHDTFKQTCQTEIRHYTRLKTTKLGSDNTVGKCERIWTVKSTNRKRHGANTDLWNLFFFVVFYNQIMQHLKKAATLRRQSELGNLKYGLQECVSGGGAGVYCKYVGHN